MWKKLLYKTGIAYLVLCLLAYGYYWLGVKWLDFDIRDGEKIQNLSMSLWGWTATMVTPVAAFFALDGWREQQKKINISNIAGEVLVDYEKFKIALLFLAVDIRKIIESNLLCSDSLNEIIGNTIAVRMPSQELSSEIAKLAFVVAGESEAESKKLSEINEKMNLEFIKLMKDLLGGLEEIHRYKEADTRISIILELGDGELRSYCRDYILYKN